MLSPQCDGKIQVKVKLNFVITVLLIKGLYLSAKILPDQFHLNNHLLVAIDWMRSIKIVLALAE